MITPNCLNHLALLERPFQHGGGPIPALAVQRPPVPLVAGLSAWLAAAGVAHVVGSATRMGAAAAGLAGGAAGLAVVALALWALREPELRALVSRP